MSGYDWGRRSTGLPSFQPESTPLSSSMNNSRQSSLLSILKERTGTPSTPLTTPINTPAPVGEQRLNSSISKRLMMTPSMSQSTPTIPNSPYISSATPSRIGSPPSARPSLEDTRAFVANIRAQSPRRATWRENNNNTITSSPTPSLSQTPSQMQRNGRVSPPRFITVTPTLFPSKYQPTNTSSSPIKRPSSRHGQTMIELRDDKLYYIGVWRRTPYDVSTPPLALNGDEGHVHLDSYDADRGSLWRLRRSELDPSIFVLECDDVGKLRYLTKKLILTEERVQAALWRIESYTSFRGGKNDIAVVIYSDDGLQLVSEPTSKVVCLLGPEKVDQRDEKGNWVYNIAWECTVDDDQNDPELREIEAVLQNYMPDADQ